MTICLILVGCFLAVFFRISSRRVCRVLMMEHNNNIWWWWWWEDENGMISNTEQAVALNGGRLDWFWFVSRLGFVWFGSRRLPFPHSESVVDRWWYEWTEKVLNREQKNKNETKQILWLLTVRNVFEHWGRRVTKSLKAAAVVNTTHTHSCTANTQMHTYTHMFYMWTFAVTFSGGLRPTWHRASTHTDTTKIHSVTITCCCCCRRYSQS